jgi:hypothetical protein
MITREQAEEIASLVVRKKPGDITKTWELVEFNAGWLIQVPTMFDRSLRGGVTRVIERADGRVMRFPSYVPPDRILNEYDDVVEDGFVEDLGS